MNAVIRLQLLHRHRPFADVAAKQRFRRLQIHRQSICRRNGGVDTGGHRTDCLGRAVLDGHFVRFDLRFLSGPLLGALGFHLFACLAHNRLRVFLARLIVGTIFDMYRHAPTKIGCNALRQPLGCAHLRNDRTGTDHQRDGDLIAVDFIGRAIEIAVDRRMLLLQFLYQRRQHLGRQQLRRIMRRQRDALKVEHQSKFLLRDVQMLPLLQTRKFRLDGHRSRRTIHAGFANDAATERCARFIGQVRTEHFFYRKRLHST